MSASKKTRRPPWGLVVGGVIVLAVAIGGLAVVRVHLRWNAAATRVAELVPNPARAPGPPSDGDLSRLRDALALEPARFDADELGAWLLQAADAESESGLPVAPASITAALEEMSATLLSVVTWLPPPEALAGSGLSQAETQRAQSLQHLLEARALISARRGQAEQASRELEAARALEVAATGAAPGRVLLGALRIVRVSDPETWIARLDAVDVRRTQADESAALARAMTPEWMERWLDERLPKDMPRILGTLARVTHGVPLRWRTAAAVEAELEVREILLSAAPCEDLSSRFPPSWAWQSRVADHLPMRHRRVATDLARVMRTEADIALTRDVLARRAGRPVPEPECASPYVPQESAGGTVTLRLSREIPGDGEHEALRTFTFTPAPVERPLMASAPVR